MDRNSARESDGEMVRKRGKTSKTEASTCSFLNREIDRNGDTGKSKREKEFLDERRR